MSNWMQSHQAANQRHLLALGYVTVNEYGEVKLTDKGKQRAGKRLDKLPTGDELLIQIAVLEHHGVSVTVGAADDC